MPSFSQEYIERVKTANPIQDVIGERIALTKNGKNFKACCPFHNEKTPSFSSRPTEASSNASAAAKAAMSSSS